MRSAFRNRTTRGLRYSALVAASALYLTGCGGDHSTKPPRSATTATTATLRDAIAAPDAVVLKLGQTVTVPPRILHTKGWQASCIAGNRRVNAEAIRGQRTGSGRIISYAGGTPSIWAKHNSDGSITLTCK